MFSPAARRLLLALAIGLLAVFLRLPALEVDILNEDEALYATAAAAMQAGAPPYRAGVESKPPGIFYLYRAAFDLFGRYDMRALHAATIPWVLATGIFLVLLVHGNLFAALFYYVFVTVQRPTVLATQCELVYSLPLAIAAWLFMHEDWRRTTLAGLLICAATLIKPTAVSLLLAALVFSALRREWLRALALVAGFAVGWGAAALFFMRLGVWRDLVYWTFVWTTQLYVPTGFGEFPWLSRFLVHFGRWLLMTLPLWLLAVRALRKREPLAIFLGLWTLASAAMACLGGRFYDHYFPAVVLPLAGLAALGTVGLSAWWQRGAIALTLAAGAISCYAAIHFYATLEWLGERRLRHEEISRYVNEHTRPQDRIFVWGYYPLIYVSADRLAATRFVGCHYLTGYAAVGLGRKLPPAEEDRLQVPNGFSQLLADLEEDKAELIVDTAPAGLHFWQNYPLSRYPQLAEYVRSHFAPEATVDDAVIYRRRR